MVLLEPVHKTVGRCLSYPYALLIHRQLFLLEPVLFFFIVLFLVFPSSLLFLYWFIVSSFLFFMRSSFLFDILRNENIKNRYRYVFVQKSNDSHLFLVKSNDS